MGGLEKGQKDAFIILMVSYASPEPYVQHNDLHIIYKGLPI